MRRHEPGVIWPLRMWEKKPNGYVRTLDKDSLVLFYARDEHDEASEGSCMVVDRRSARLLARRILECLEATK